MGSACLQAVLAWAATRPIQLAAAKVASGRIRLQHIEKAVARQLNRPVSDMGQLQNATRRHVVVSSSPLCPYMVANHVHRVDLERPFSRQVDIGRSAIKSGRRNILLMSVNETTPDPASDDVPGAVFVVAAKWTASALPRAGGSRPTVVDEQQVGSDDAGRHLAADGVDVVDGTGSESTR